MIEEAAPPAAGLRIVQVVRRLGPGGGVGGVAFALDRAFSALGAPAESITADSLGLASGRDRLAQFREIVGFTWRGSRAAGRARRAGAVVLVHGDALGGDLYVDHGLHRALLGRRPWLLLHPLHVFIALRETLRHRLAGPRIACLSGAAEAALRRAHPATRGREIARVRNGVALDRFHPEPGRLERAFDPEDLRLVFVGHEFGRKGLVHAIDALGRLPAGVRLDVLGGTPRTIAAALRRAARLGVADRVRFHGAGADVAEHLRRSDLLVLPSAWEASPLVVLEAQASGVPVLLAEAAWSAELAGEGGVLTAAPTGPAIAEAVRRLTADPATVLRLKREAVLRARRSGWLDVAAEYVALADRLRRGRGAP